LGKEGFLARYFDLLARMAEWGRVDTAAHLFGYLRCDATRFARLATSAGALSTGSSPRWPALASRSRSERPPPPDRLGTTCLPCSTARRARRADHPRLRRAPGRDVGYRADEVAALARRRPDPSPSAKGGAMTSFWSLPHLPASAGRSPRAEGPATRPSRRHTRLLRPRALIFVYAEAAGWLALLHRTMVARPPAVADPHPVPPLPTRPSSICLSPSAMPRLRRDPPLHGRALLLPLLLSRPGTAICDRPRPLRCGRRARRFAALAPPHPAAFGLVSPPARRGSRHHAPPTDLRPRRRPSLRPALPPRVHEIAFRTPFHNGFSFGNRWWATRGPHCAPSTPSPPTSGALFARPATPPGDDRQASPPHSAARSLVAPRPPRHGPAAAHRPSRSACLLSVAAGACSRGLCLRRDRADTFAIERGLAPSRRLEDLGHGPDRRRCPAELPLTPSALLLLLAAARTALPRACDSFKMVNPPP
jgi:hypothetical protein